jgi:hypothetical protein
MRDVDGNVDRMRVDLDHLPHLLAALDTTARPSDNHEGWALESRAAPVTRPAVSSGRAPERPAGVPADARPVPAAEPNPFVTPTDQDFAARTDQDEVIDLTDDSGTDHEVHTHNGWPEAPAQLLVTRTGSMHVIELDDDRASAPAGVGEGDRGQEAPR